jgi:hypothetical protein
VDPGIRCGAIVAVLGGFGAGRSLSHLLSLCPTTRPTFCPTISSLESYLSHLSHLKEVKVFYREKERHPDRYWGCM